jgi:hypothetical protein
VRDGDAETIRANARHFLQALRTAREAPLSR